MPGTPARPAVRRRRNTPLSVESLGSKVLLSSMSVSLSRGELRIRGSNDADEIEVRIEGDEVTIGDWDRSYSLGQVRKISVDGRGGDDRIEIVDDSASWSVPTCLKGGGGHDEIYGGAGKDNIDGGSGDDLIYGGEGNDCLNGGSGDDELDGEDGDDKLDGGSGHDYLLGGFGNDRLSGGTDDDELDGGEGDDKLDGGRGDDLLWVLYADDHDSVYGGSGADTFVLGEDSEEFYDQVKDFRHRNRDAYDFVWSHDSDSDGTPDHEDEDSPWSVHRARSAGRVAALRIMGF